MPLFLLLLLHHFFFLYVAEVLKLGHIGTSFFFEFIGRPIKMVKPAIPSGVPVRQSQIYVIIHVTYSVSSRYITQHSQGFKKVQV